MWKISNTFRKYVLDSTAEMEKCHLLFILGLISTVAVFHWEAVPLMLFFSLLNLVSGIQLDSHLYLAIRFSGATEKKKLTHSDLEKLNVMLFQERKFILFTHWKNKGIFRKTY